MKIKIPGLDFFRRNRLENIMNDEVTKAIGYAAKYAEEYYTELWPKNLPPFEFAKVIIADDSSQLERELPQNVRDAFDTSGSPAMVHKTDMIIFIKPNIFIKFINTIIKDFYQRKGLTLSVTQKLNLCRVATMMTIFHEYGHIAQNNTIGRTDNHTRQSREIREKNADYTSGAILVHTINKRGTTFFDDNDLKHVREFVERTGFDYLLRREELYRFLLEIPGVLHATGPYGHPSVEVRLQEFERGYRSGKISLLTEEDIFRRS